MLASHIAIPSLSFVKPISLIAGVTIQDRHIALEIRLNMSLCYGPRDILAFLEIGSYGMSELLDPLVDPDGKRWFDLTSAAEHLHYAATPPTLARWAEQGKTSFGLPVESKRVPLKMNSHRSEGSFYKPRFPRTDRPVISETTVNALNTVFGEVFDRKRKHDGYSNDEKARLESATHRYLSTPHP